MSSRVPRSPAPEVPPQISREEILRRLDDRALVLLNVLPQKAFDEGHIPHSLHLPVRELRERAFRLIPNLEQEIAVYCGGGG